ncbi:MAG: chemotaxis protein CheA [Candidatus Accumulibacter sp.]|jgi:two-component system chemotaxis sensor kinase CheA|nr:chemotaxis protein CheA [Accumulibacter sp.]
MSDFSGLEDLLQDFLQEANELLSDVDNKLVDLEKNPEDRGLLDAAFRGFHTIKGGGGFLNATELVKLCHLTESLFDRLRTGKMRLTPRLMDVIMAATQSIRNMFDELARQRLPAPASPDLLQTLRDALDEKGALADAGEKASPASAAGTNEPDWEALFHALTGVSAASAASEVSRAPSEKPLPEGDTISPGRAMASPTAADDKKLPARAQTVRVEVARLDHVLNLSNEISLMRNHVNALWSEVLSGNNDPDTIHSLDRAVGQLDLLVHDLQNSVMRTQMQAVGRLFQKFPRIVRDLSRQLDKDIELLLLGEDTEINRNLIEDLLDPMIHLIRNAIDHGIEHSAERQMAGKPPKGVVRIEARQEGDRFILVVADDGHGMLPAKIRQKAVEKDLLLEKDAAVLDDSQSLNLIFLPGFSTLSEASSVSGRGVGMDVVKQNIEKLNGTIDIHTVPGEGTAFSISLPLTLAILPSLLVLLDDQPFAIPLAMIREILPIDTAEIQEIGGKDTLLVRGEILPVIPLSRLFGWAGTTRPGYGVLIETTEWHFILAVDDFMGYDNAVIKPLDNFCPRGVSGVTTLPSGQIVLILNMKELLADFHETADENLRFDQFLRI